MKRPIIILSLIILVLTGCQAQADNSFNAPVLKHQIDSVGRKILSERLANGAGKDYVPNSKDVDRCISLCDTLISHNNDHDAITTKLNMLLVAKRYSEFIEFGRSTTCSFMNETPVPGLFYCKLNALQCRVNKDKTGEKKNVENALNLITQYMSKSETTFQSLLKMDKKEFDSVVIKNYKSNQSYVNAMATMSIYQNYVILAQGIDAWNAKFKKLCKEYPNSSALAFLKNSQAVDLTGSVY